MSELWVFNEPGQPVVEELLAKGRELADGAGMTLCRVTVQWSGFEHDRFTEALSQLAKERKPEIVLFGATAIGKTLAPLVAAELETGLTADCTKLEIDESGLLKMIRPAYGGNVLATVVCEKHRPQMATVQPGAFKPALVEFEDIKIVPAPSDGPKRMEKLHAIEQPSGQPGLHAAEFIITGGRGMGAPENFGILEKLAEVLGGVVGASKAVVDIGWKKYEHQIGLSGANVAPVVYIACGVSGAIQHWEGIKSADIIVAINTDPAAPIFDYADFGLVGNAVEVVPELIRQLNARNRTE